MRIISREAKGVEKSIKDMDEAQKKMAEDVKKKEQDLRLALDKCKDWDVTGTWRSVFHTSKRIGNADMGIRRE